MEEIKTIDEFCKRVKEGKSVSRLDFEIKFKWDAAASAKLKAVVADLRSADLSYADLRSADLSYADLRSADLSYADLSYAKAEEKKYTLAEACEEIAKDTDLLLDMERSNVDAIDSITETRIKLRSIAKRLREKGK